MNLEERVIEVAESDPELYASDTCSVCRGKGTIRDLLPYGDTMVEGQAYVCECVYENVEAELLEDE